MSTGRPRAPLVSIPNATNSPQRLLFQTTGKRQRQQQGASLHEHEPPPKKKYLPERSPRRDNPPIARGKAPPQSPQSTAEGRVFEFEAANAAPTDFQRRLIAAKKVSAKADPDHAESSLRSWHKHYRKVFPSFVFYFDGVPADLHVRLVKCLDQLGAREERFFSRSVTHIVTTRPIPPESPASNLESKHAPKTQTECIGQVQPQTINPCLLDKKSIERGNIHPCKSQASENSRRDTTVAATDVLSRGRQMNMKIWALEKLHRILTSMLEYDANHSHNAVTAIKTAAMSRPCDGDLSQSLRKEKLDSYLERDQAAAMKEMVMFRGPFIYVHDMEGKTRPVMVREYPKVNRKSDGAWPQFRSVSLGRCPFIEEPHARRDLDREREQHMRDLRLARQQQPSPRQAPKFLCQDAPPMAVRRSPRRVIREMPNLPAPSQTTKEAILRARNLEPPNVPTPTAFDGKPVPAGDFTKPTHEAALCREPVASGIQRSNLTSAIRSQMISSTASGPGARGSTSKEVNELKRKVLERTYPGSLSVSSIPSSHRMTDLAGVLQNARAPAPQRAAKSKAQEKLVGAVGEAANNSGDELSRVRMPPTAPQKQKAVAVRKEPKPGYCENCRDKYEDFDDHIASRRHRKFAANSDNWTELDRLLRILQESERPDDTEEEDEDGDDL